MLFSSKSFVGGKSFVPSGNVSPLFTRYTVIIKCTADDGTPSKVHTTVS